MDLTCTLLELVIDLTYGFSCFVVGMIFSIIMINKNKK